LSNDDAIRSAAVKLILEAGIDSISFRDVGREAGLTHGALYARFEDVEELLVDLWTSVLCGRAIKLLDAAREAATHPSDDSIEALLRTTHSVITRRGANTAAVSGITTLYERCSARVRWLARTLITESRLLARRLLCL
jgi:AcrR family transcriptional regulator